MHPPSNQPSNPSGDLTETAGINKEDDDSIAKGLGFTVVAITLLLVGAAVVAYFSKDIPQSFKDVKKFGEIGDFIGGILNPIISGCTLFIAHKVWKLQKAELAATREELQNSRKVMEVQTRIAEQQRSQQRFFDLLKIYQDLVINLSIDDMQGKAAFKVWRRNEGLFIFSMNPLPIVDDLEKPLGFNPNSPFYSVMGAWSKNRNLFLQYFSIIKTIFGELENLTGEDHERYGNLFRSQLSEDEVFLLAFEALLADREKDLKTIIGKYGLLKFLPGGSLRTYAKQKLTPECFED